LFPCLRRPKTLLCFFLQLDRPRLDIVQHGIRRAMVRVDPERDLAGTPAVLAYDEICVRAVRPQ